MNIKLLLFLFILAQSSCTISKNTKVNTPASERLKGQVVSGWNGILPCADCEEIHYDLTLLPNGKYYETTIYMGKSMYPLKDSGTWFLSADSMLLLHNNESKRYFYFNGNELIMRDTEGKEISSSFEKMYRLQRAVSEESSALWNKKMLEGIHFTASGNEPFWSLDIIFDSSIHFKTMEGQEIILPIGKGAKASNTNVIRFHSETADGSINVQLFKQTCIDNISGTKSPYKVAVQGKLKGDSGYKKYKGCGRFIGDYRLNDIWALQRIGNRVINPKEFENGVPPIEFQLSEGKIYGFGGCNHFFGNIQFGEGKISFNKVGSTEIACPGLKLETQFLGMFSDKTLAYKVTDGKLYLGSGDNMLAFKKVD